MTDIRERHVRAATDECRWCMRPWPCDAIREANEKQKYAETLSRIADETRGEPKMSGGSLFRSHREGRIHNLVREAFGEEPLTIAEHPLTLQDRADKAEAALAQECPDCGLSVAQVGRIHIDAQMGHEDYLAAYARADKAEAALASLLANGPEERIWMEYKRERDAARAAAENWSRLAEEAERRADTAEAALAECRDELMTADAYSLDYKRKYDAARADAKALAEALEKHAPALPPTKKSYLNTDLCASRSCEARIERECGPMKRGMYEWVKDITQHAADCGWVKDRAALAAHKEATK